MPTVPSQKPRPRFFRKNGHILTPRKKTDTAASLTLRDFTAARTFSDGPQKPRHRKYTRRKKVLMFGWELPPFNSGGLGVASYELAHSLSQHGADITFVLPKQVPIDVSFMKVRFASDAQTSQQEMQTVLSAYKARAASGQASTDELDGLLGEVMRYGMAAARIAQEETFDVVHAHDWLCAPAGFCAKAVAGKPLVFHVHATEYDRTGDGGVNEHVYHIEHEALLHADRVIAVSEYTKRMLIDRYGADAACVDVVHNGVNVFSPNKMHENLSMLKSSGKKLVLFVGRLTLQKGPDYFLRAARIVADYDKEALFIIAGAGDMQHQIFCQAAYLGLSDRILFAGFARGDELSSLYRAADVFVMPSVSEPFGITALEALAHGTPVILSKQSGVAEVIRNGLQVNFWDVEEIANKILSVLRYKSMKAYLSVSGGKEARAHSWEKAARECLAVYEKL